MLFLFKNVFNTVVMNVTILSTWWAECMCVSAVQISHTCWCFYCPRGETCCPVGLFDNTCLLFPLPNYILDGPAWGLFTVAADSFIVICIFSVFLCHCTKLLSYSYMQRHQSASYKRHLPCCILVDVFSLYQLLMTTDHHQIYPLGLKHIDHSHYGEQRMPAGSCGAHCWARHSATCCAWNIWKAASEVEEFIPTHLLCTEKTLLHLGFSISLLFTEHHPQQTLSECSTAGIYNDSSYLPHIMFFFSEASLRANKGLVDFHSSS